MNLPYRRTARRALPPPAKQARKEVDDAIIPITNLTNHRTDNHKDRDDDGVPQTDGQDEDGEHKAREAICHGEGMPLGVHPGSLAEPLHKADGIAKILGGHRIAHRAHDLERVAQAVLDRAVAIFEETGALAAAHERALALAARAKKTLASVELDNAGRSLFMDMADFFVERLQ